MYEKEVVDEEAKLERMRADGRDEYDIKKQVVSSFCGYQYRSAER